MRTVMLWLVAVSSAHAADVGLDLGVVSVDKAASLQPALLFGLHADVPVHERLSVGAELAGARLSETNEPGRLVSWPLRASTTVDIHAFRQTLDVRFGVGPALRITPVRVQSGGQTFSGTAIRGGLRLRAGLGGPVSGRWHWGLGSGATVLSTGIDWDATARVSFRIGDAR